METENTHLRFDMISEFKDQLNNNREFKEIHGNNYFRDKNFKLIILWIGGMEIMLILLENIILYTP